jgi:hypothetical protein
MSVRLRQTGRPVARVKRDAISADVRQYPGAKLKIAILSSADVAGWYFATLLQHGHQAIFVGGQGLRAGAPWLAGTV